MQNLKVCGVCTTGDSAPYKCSKCREPYCSVACYKVHKEVCTVAQALAQAQAGPTSSSSTSSSSDTATTTANATATATHGTVRSTSTAGARAERNVLARPGMTTAALDTPDILSAEQLAALDRSHDLSAMLRSERLQKHILQVDGAANRQGALKRLRTAAPEFNEFVGKLLRLTETAVVVRPAETTGSSRANSASSSNGSSSSSSSSSMAQREADAEMKRLVQEAEAAAAAALLEEEEEEDTSGTEGAAEGEDAGKAANDGENQDGIRGAVEVE